MSALGRSNNQSIFSEPANIWARRRRHHPIQFHRQNGKGWVEILICSVSLLETAILYRLGRLELDVSLEDFFSVALSADLHLLELTSAIAGATNQLPKNFPGDPFDRTIVATAVLDVTLITTDRAIREAHVCSVEDYPFKPSPF